MGNVKTSRVGETNYNNAGYLMKIVEYESTLSIVVEFEDSDKTRVKSQYQYFKHGRILNPSDKKRRHTASPVRRTRNFYENLRTNCLSASYI